MAPIQKPIRCVHKSGCSWLHVAVVTCIRGRTLYYMLLWLHVVRGLKLGSFVGTTWQPLLHIAIAMAGLFARPARLLADHNITVTKLLVAFEKEIVVFAICRCAVFQLWFVCNDICMLWGEFECRTYKDESKPQGYKNNNRTHDHRKHQTQTNNKHNKPQTRKQKLTL